MSFRKSSAAPPSGPDADHRVVRKRLADGTVKEYRYPRRAVAKVARYAPDSIDALLAAYRRSPEWLALSQHTRDTYSIYHRPLDRIGHTKVRDLRRRAIMDLRDAIAVTRGPGAATGFVRAVKALLTWAADRDWIEQSPAWGVKGVRGNHLPAWTEGVLGEALRRLPEPYRRVVVLAVHTGQRRGDLIALTWGAYDGGTIRLRQQKTGKPLVVPVHRDLAADLDTWRAEKRPATTILTSPRGLPWTAQHLSRELGREVKALGFGRFTVHGLRKLAATRLAEAGCSTHEIAAVTGHGTLGMVELYTRSAEQHRLAEAAITRLETGVVKPTRNRRLRD